MEKIEEKKQNLEDEYRTNSYNINDIEKEINNLNMEKKDIKVILTYIISIVMYLLIISISSVFGTTAILTNEIPVILASILSGSIISNSIVSIVKKINNIQNPKYTRKELDEKLLELETKKSYLETINRIISDTYFNIDENTIIENNDELVRDYQESKDYLKELSFRERLNYRYYKYREKPFYITRKAISSFLITSIIISLLMIFPASSFGLTIPTIDFLFPIIAGLTSSTFSIRKSKEELKSYIRYNNSLLDLKMDDNEEPKWIENQELFREPMKKYGTSRLNLDETTIKRINNMREDNKILTLNDIYKKEEIIPVTSIQDEKEKVRKLTK